MPPPSARRLPGANERRLYRPTERVAGRSAWSALLSSCGSARQVRAGDGKYRLQSLGEVLALRWRRVEIDKAVIQVREALEPTEAHGIRFKQPKSKAGRRDITLPDILVDALREYRKAQLELRMKLGAGKRPDDALLFGDINGNPPSPNAFSAAWSDFAASKQVDIPDVTVQIAICC